MPTTGTYDPQHAMTGSREYVRVLATLCLVGCLFLVAFALVLGFHIEATPRAVADAARGQAVGLPAAVGLIASVIALVVGSRPSGRIAVGFALAMTGLATVLLVTG